MKKLTVAFELGRFLSYQALRTFVSYSLQLIFIELKAFGRTNGWCASHPSQLSFTNTNSRQYNLIETAHKISPVGSVKKSARNKIFSGQHVIIDAEGD